MTDREDGVIRESDLDDEDDDLEEDDWGEEEEEEDWNENEDDSSSLSVPWQIEDCWDLQGRQGVMVL